MGTLVLRPVEGEDIVIELCPGYAAGQAAQDERRLRIRDVVGDAVETHEVFAFTSFDAAGSDRRPVYTAQFVP